MLKHWEMSMLSRNEKCCVLFRVQNIWISTKRKKIIEYFNFPSRCSKMDCSPLITISDWIKDILYVTELFVCSFFVVDILLNTFDGELDFIEGLLINTLKESLHKFLVFNELLRLISFCHNRLHFWIVYAARFM